MQPEAKKYLYDIEQACAALMSFVEGKTLDDYNDSLLLRSAVERQFEIVGEALNNAIKMDTSLESKITSARDIINFHSLIIHGYNIIENHTVWGTIVTHLPVLIEEVQEILKT